MFIVEFILGLIALVTIFVLTSLIGRLLFYMVERERLGYSLGEHAFSFIPGAIAIVIIVGILTLSSIVGKAVLVYLGLEHG